MISKDIINLALQEDKIDEDITSKLLIDETTKVKAVIIAKEACKLAGIKLTEEVFKTVDKTIKFKRLKSDGEDIKPQEIVAELQGKALSILKAERTALNFLSHLCGVATITCEFVKKAFPFGVKIRDTRKTIPGLRSLQKQAVKLAGAIPHRASLKEAILIKDNHLKILSLTKSNAKIFEYLLEKITACDNKCIGIEIQNEANLQELLKYIPQGDISKRIIIMLDNFSLNQLKEAIKLIKKKNIKVEVSGGITLDNVEEIAKLKPDYISVGKITHSVKAIDFSLEVNTSL
jgi:nicotinate-nucleotide pyrophosphorylase (carboxylating)